MHGAVQHLIVIMDFDANLIPIDRASRMNASAILFFRSSAETFGLSSFLFDDKGK
jgi:hypothetical protein